jgi:threonine dehydrogenase-like Zn-dependent dehydrogenase
MAREFGASEVAEPGDKGVTQVNELAGGLGVNSVFEVGGSRSP